MKNATFRQLRVFNEVARHLSFARAAENLHLTPPAVTMQVKELEGHVGMPLFERQGKQVSLTTTGEYMLVYTRRILATVKDAEDAAARLQRAETGVLTIGMVSTAKYFMMKMLAEFRSKHVGVELKPVIGNRDQLVQMLQNNEVDIAVMGRPPVEDLRPYDFIVREPGSGTRSAMEKFFVEARVKPRLQIQLHSNETLKQAVMAGLGIGFISLHTIGLELQHGLIALLDVEGAPVVRAWNVVHTQSKMLSPAAEAFRYFMLEQGEAHLANQFGHCLPF